jgi:hypothetical protein
MVPDPHFEAISAIATLAFRFLQAPGRQESLVGASTHNRYECWRPGLKDKARQVSEFRPRE